MLREALMVTWAATIAELVSAQPARDSREPSVPPMKMAPGAFQGSLIKPRTKGEGGWGWGWESPELSGGKNEFIPPVELRWRSGFTPANQFEPLPLH